MAAFSIKIEPGPLARFNPRNQRADPGDVISWNNTTGDAHQIWQLVGADLSMLVGSTTVELALPIGAERWALIPPNGSSPAWTVPNLPSGTCFRYRSISDAGSVIGLITIN